MTFASISTALPLAVAMSLVLSWGLCKSGLQANRAALWAFSLGLLAGVAALLSDSPAGMVRAVWPREAVDWLPLAALVLTAVAAWQQPEGRIALVVGVLLGIAIVCRLLFGSIYLRPAGTSATSLAAIALGGAAIGVGWYLELGRRMPIPWAEAGVNLALFLGAAAILGMSGSMKYGMIGVLVTLVAGAAWLATRSWPGVSNLVILMLLGLGLAYAELQVGLMIGVSALVLACSLIGRVPSARQRWRIPALAFIVAAVAVCAGLTAQQFFKDVKGNNASYGGYEAYK